MLPDRLELPGGPKKERKKKNPQLGNSFDECMNAGWHTDPESGKTMF